MTDRPTDRLMTMFYAAVQAIADGSAAEIQLDHTIGTPETEERWSIEIRHAVRQFELPTVTED